MFRLLSLFLFLGMTAACVNLKPVDTEYDEKLSCSNISEVHPVLPPSAEKRLLEVIGGSHILFLYELDYVAAGKISYLVANGLFYFKDGGHSTEFFVLRKVGANESWIDADVYWLNPDSGEYVGPTGEIIERPFMYGAELFALPESVRTNLLERAENFSWEKGRRVSP